jgi:hypothetical protein
MFISVQKTALATHLPGGLSGKIKTSLSNTGSTKIIQDVIFKDTSYALLVFNTCENGRGYFLKLSYAKKSSFRKSTTAINNFDPRFSVADSLLAYTDKGNLFVEDIGNDKQASMTFGKELDFDFDAIHETLDSVSITRNRIWAKVKVDGEWKTLEKNITLQ